MARTTRSKDPKQNTQTALHLACWGSGICPCVGESGTHRRTRRSPQRSISIVMTSSASALIQPGLCDVSDAFKYHNPIVIVDFAIHIWLGFEFFTYDRFS